MASTQLDLTHLHEARERLATAHDDVYAEVAKLRAAGASWTAIGAAFGITRQAAWERFSREVATR